MHNKPIAIVTSLIEHQTYRVAVTVYGLTCEHAPA